MNRKRETLIGYLFLAPALIVFLMLVAFPVVMSLGLAFTKWNFFSGWGKLEFVGIDNFVKLFTRDRSFKTALVNTLLYTVTTVPLSIFMALILAYVLTGKVYGKRFFRVAFFIPYISNMVALGAVFKFLFRSEGPVNSLLTGVLGLDGMPQWLSSPNLSRVPIICVMVYAGIGFCLIIYIAALKNVPRELYEAAAIDGASQVRQFFDITIPLISPATIYLTVVRMIAAFQVFAPINIITSGGKSSGSVSLVVLIYEEAFKNYNFGYASAESWILVVFILGVTLLQFLYQKKWVHY